MARIRTIKPEFWTSEQILNLTIPARLLFIGLWNFCDDGGNHVASERALKAKVFPSDDLDSTIIRRMIDELSRQGLIVEYEAGGKTYWHVTGWHHQKIDKPNPKLPVFNDSTIIRRTFDDHSTQEGKGKEGIVREEEKEGIVNIVARATKKNEVDVATQYQLLKAFEDFWKVYPKTNCPKKEAMRSWSKISINDLPAVAAGLNDYIAYLRRETWQKPAHQTTWLNQRRWEVDYSAISPTQTSASSEQQKADEVKRINEERRARILNATQIGGENHATAITTLN